MIKKYLILALILSVCAGSIFAQRYSDDPSTGFFRNWTLGFGNDPFQISDELGLTSDDEVTEVTAREEEKEDGEGEGEEKETLEPEKIEKKPESKLNFSAGTFVTLVPLQFVSRDTAEYLDNYWFGTGSELTTNVSFFGHYDGKFGFATDLDFSYTPGGDSIEMGFGSSAHIWVRPADWFRLDAGRFYNGSQAGKVGGHWLSAWTVGMRGGSNIFSGQYAGSIGLLAQFKIPPVKGLALSLFIPSFGISFTGGEEDFSWLSNSSLTPGGDKLNSDDNFSNRQRAIRIFERTWFTVSYTFKDDSNDENARKDELHIRFQYIGANPNGSVNWTTGSGSGRTDVQPYRYRVSVAAPRVEAAFAYSLRDKFSIDLGVKSWLPISSWMTDVYSQDLDNPNYLMSGDGVFWGGIGFGLGLKINVTKEFIINLRADGEMLRNWTGIRDGDVSITNPMHLSCHLWPSYILPNKMVVMAAVGVNYSGRNQVDLNGENPNKDSLDWDRSDRLRIGGGLSLMIPLFGQRSFVSVGLAYNNGTDDTRGGESRTITIPVNFSVAF